MLPSRKPKTMTETEKRSLEKEIVGLLDTLEIMIRARETRAAASDGVERVRAEGGAQALRELREGISK